MGLRENQAQSFLAPLIGRATTFLVESREANLAFARALMVQVAACGGACAILDLDALYSSNSDQIFAPSDSGALSGTIIRIPRPGADLDVELASLFEVEQKVVVIDSLNSLYHLIAQEDGSSRSRKMSFAMSSLSYFARTNSKSVILSMYRREGFLRGGSTRSIASLTDRTIAVDARGQDVIFRNEKGPGWPGGQFSIRFPSG